MSRTANVCLAAILVTVIAADSASATRPSKPLSHLSSGAGDAPEAPSWPKSYSVQYNFSLPYMLKIQPHGLSYPVAFYKDDGPRGGIVRMDTYNGTTALIARKGLELELEPQKDTLACAAYKLDDWDGAMAERDALPDVSDWTYGGRQQLGGRAADVWVYTALHLGKDVVYKFYVAAHDSVGGYQLPLRLAMHGNNLFSGAHFDEWILEYDPDSFRPGPPDTKVFLTPTACRGVPPSLASGPRGGSMRMAALLPAVRYSGHHAAYDSFLGTPHGAGRRHHSLKEYRQRAAVFQANLDMITAHNAANGASYTMALNRFADWTQAEFEAAMLPKRARRQAQGQESVEAPSHSNRGLSKHEMPFVNLTDPARLPRDLSWRGSGADGPVKDQANCGSCWSFASTGVLQAAWYLATGQAVTFSEQQILDCSWGFSTEQPWATTSCDGGEQWAGVGYVVEAGGIALNTEYEYLAQPGYCRENSTRRTGIFNGYMRTPHGDDGMLMEAVYSRGPASISIDASQPSFRFYSSGVYFDPHCGYKPVDLDHAVVLVGYGSNPSGDYWLVKNSWSTHWGDGGYVKIARENHGCGVSTDGLVAIVDAAAAAKAAAAAA